MRNITKSIGLLVVALTVTFLTSCQKDEISNEDTIAQFSLADNSRAAQADNAVDASLTIIDNGYQEGEEGRSQLSSLFTDCTTITIEPNGNGGVITLDFGDGCTLNNGAVVSGKIVLEYGAIIGGTRTINYTFVDYTYNQNSVMGGGEVFREIANEDGNPQSTVNEAITVSFPNTDITATRTGTRISEWVEGVGSGVWLDNVYHVTGNWDTVLTNGFTRSGNVTQALVAKVSCPYLVSGVLDVTQNTLSGAIDWGDGACDNQATITINGEVYDIIL